jgi:hypothetical protein
MICHEIEAKQTGREHATVLRDNNLLDVDDSVQNLIKERLAKAAENPTKAFTLQIEDYVGGSCFTYCSTMKGQPNDVFIKNSQEIANLLAQCQTKNSIPGGNLIIIEALDKYDKAVYLIVKAELQAALRYEPQNNSGKINYFDDLFLSGEKKLYKFGIFYERSEVEKPEFDDLNYPNDHWGAFLYDASFNPDSKPAEYFYQDFLGFDISNNGKIQSKRFYTSTESFVKANVESAKEKEDLLKVLKSEFLNEDLAEERITPDDFAELYFHDDEVKDLYKNEVVQYLPQTIEKDPSLIKSRIKKKKLVFPNSITIAGPDNTFDLNVKVVADDEELSELELNSPDYTLIKVLGNPQQEQ